MEKFLKLIFLLATGLFFLVSCEDYLDKAPESGLSEAEVFSKYENFMKYFDGIYAGKTQGPHSPTNPSLVDGEYNIKSAHSLFWSVGNQKAPGRIILKLLMLRAELPPVHLNRAHICSTALSIHTLITGPF